METFEYQKCLACQSSWQSPQSAANQMEYAQKMLEKYLRPKDWNQVQFSNGTLGEGV